MAKKNRESPGQDRGGERGGKTGTPSDDPRGAGLTAQDKQQGVRRKGRNTDGTGL